MNRPVFNAMAAQYRVTRAEGTDHLRWEEGVRCRLPALTLRGCARQEGLDSRNLFWRQGGGAYDGLTVDYDADTQTFTLNGTVTGSPLIRLCTGMTIPWETGRRYTLARFYEGGSAAFASGSVLWSVFTADNAAYFSRISDSSDTAAEAVRSVTGDAIAPPAQGFVFYLQCLGVSVTFTDYRVRFLLTPAEDYDGSWQPCTLPRPGAPRPILPNSAVVKLRGGNLYTRKAGSWTEKGVSIRFDPLTETFTLDGTLTAAGDLMLDEQAILPWREGERHTVSILPAGGSVQLGEGSGITYAFSFFSKDRGAFFRSGNLSEPDMTRGHCFTAASIPESGGEGYFFYLQCWRRGTVFHNFSFRVQVEEGTAATPWQRGFYGGTASAPDLYAIPGTDYADQWDAVSGRGVRRCAVLPSYAGEDISTPYLSSEGGLSAGATVVCGIPDTPFSTEPTPFIMPDGFCEAVCTGGSAGLMTADYLTHS